MATCGAGGGKTLEALGLGLVKRQRIKETLKRERLKGGHFGVRRIVEKKIERMPLHSLLALPLVFINVKRQSGDRLRQDADAGINRCGLHGRELVDILSGGRLAKNERRTNERSGYDEAQR